MATFMYPKINNPNLLKRERWEKPLFPDSPFTVAGCSLSYSPNSESPELAPHVDSGSKGFTSNATVLEPTGNPGNIRFWDPTLDELIAGLVQSPSSTISSLNTFQEDCNLLAQDQDLYNLNLLGQPQDPCQWIFFNEHEVVPEPNSFTSGTSTKYSVESSASNNFSPQTSGGVIGEPGDKFGNRSVKVPKLERIDADKDKVSVEFLSFSGPPASWDSLSSLKNSRSQPFNSHQSDSNGSGSPNCAPGMCTMTAEAMRAVSCNPFQGSSKPKVAKLEDGSSANSSTITAASAEWRGESFQHYKRKASKLEESSISAMDWESPFIKRPAGLKSAENPSAIRMVKRLLACAEAVACRDARQANTLLCQLHTMASPFGDSMQRVTACFVEGLTARLAVTGFQGFKAAAAQKAPSERERLEGYSLMYKHCPYLIFGHCAANKSIMEAFEGEQYLHVVDLGMTNSMQWPYLIQDLAGRRGGPPRLLRITGVGTSWVKMKESGVELTKVAEKHNIPFEFHAVEESLESLQKSMLDLREGEALAVNTVLQLHCVVKESRGSLNSVLQSIHDLSPKVLTLVEQDASHNGPFFLGRFMESLHYYSAIFDSLDAILPKYSTARQKIEQFHFAEEIKNIVSCEGPARVERHERVDQWRRRMSRAGFQPMPIKFASQARMWLSNFRCEGYTISEEKGCLVLGWKGKPIVAASSWRC